MIREQVGMQFQIAGKCGQSWSLLVVMSLELGILGSKFW